ncbi:Ankyrin repeat, partial [Dillenia turbinata]
MKKPLHEAKVRISGSSDGKAGNVKRRIERLRMSRTGNCKGTCYFPMGKFQGMNPDLYRAATTANINALLDLFESLYENDAQHSLSDLCYQVSPQMNTVLHLLVFSINYVASARKRSEVIHMIEYISDECPVLVTKTNYEGDTALHIAAREGHVEVVNVFICRREDHTGLSSEDVEAANNVLLIPNGLRNTALHEALMNHHLAVAELVISAGPEAWNYPNEEGKGPLYLAAEGGYVGLMEKMLDNGAMPDHLGKSPVHAAILGKKTGALEMIYNMKPELFRLKDEENQTPLHWAVREGYLEGIHFMLEQSTVDVYEVDKSGSCPLHLASSEGHADIVQELLKYCPEAKELLNGQGQNILHVAAMRGRFNVVEYLLKGQDHVKLINDKDVQGNTPLHLATIHCRPRIVHDLTLDKRIDINIVNKEGRTALDIAEGCWKRQALFREVLMVMALKTAGAIRASHLNCPEDGKDKNQEKMKIIKGKHKDKIDTLLLVATLITTVTFAAGFTVPGGTDISGPRTGKATMLQNSWYFSVFLLCDNIAMYSSVTVVITLMWAQLGDIHLAKEALKLAFPLLGISLMTMSVAFAADIYIVVGNLRWLANLIWIMGVLFLISLLFLFTPLWLPFSLGYRYLNCITHYPLWLLMRSKKFN